MESTWPRTAESDFAVLDAGMTELLRPALYGAFHFIEPVSRSEEAAILLPGARIQHQPVQLFDRPAALGEMDR